MIDIKYSIIIPVYNAEKTINKCIDSLLNQSVNNSLFEIICIDDGSTDDSKKLLREYVKKQKIKVIHQENSGPAVARNNGAKVATGGIIVFTDSDCVLDTHWLSEMVRPFSTNSADGVQGKYKTYQKSLIALYEQFEIENSYRKMKMRKTIDSIGTYSAAYNKELFLNNGGFNCTYRYASGEDFELSYNLSNLGHKLVFNESAVCYHHHPESLSTYLKIKFKRGYWRSMLYRNNISKVAIDSYSPNIQKFQFIFSHLTILTLMMSLAINSNMIFIVSLGIYIIICIPTMVRAMGYSIKLTILVPILTFLRAIVFGAGLLKGTYTIMKGVKL